MLEERDFTNIRRNFIFASIIFLLFLIYGNKIEVKSLLFIEFHDNNWAWISSFWDVFITLLVFWGYTFSRYIIYANRFIEEIGFKRSKLINLYNYAISFDGVSLSREAHLFYGSKLIEGNNMFNIEQFRIEGDLGNQQFIFDTDGPPEFANIGVFISDVYKIVFFNDKVCFSFSYGKKILKIELKVKKYPKGINFKILVNKEYSDFIWPLGIGWLVILGILLRGILGLWFF